MRRIAGAVAALLVLTGHFALAAGSAELVLDAGPAAAVRTTDGTTTLDVTATNLTGAALALRLRTPDGSCADADGSPALEPYTRGTITFTMACTPGSAPRTGELSAAGLTQPVRLAFTVEPSASPVWRPLWQFLLPGAVLAALSVLMPLVFWTLRPAGNEDAGGTSAPPLRWQGLFGTPLPGITTDWSFTDSWASNLTLGAGLFTAFFASTDVLPAVLGDGAQAEAAVIAAAAAVSASLVAAGPLWLTICKRRYTSQGGVARHHTVGGVVVASFVALVGAFGGVWAVAAVIDSFAAVAAALLVTAVLVLYTVKSLPQTLALGLHGDRSEVRGLSGAW
jgi:hypothetical protein